MNVVYCGDFGEPWHTESHVARELEHLGHTVTRRHGGPMRGLVDACEDADLLLLQANGGLQRNAEPWLREIERRGCETMSYHLDLYVGLARQDRIDCDVMWRTQTVWTADGDPTSQALFESKGINHRWLPAAVVSDETEPGDWRDEYDYDVVFVGAARYHDEHPWRAQMLDALHGRYGSRFRVFDHHPPTRGQALNDLYATARVVVGDTLALPEHRNYWSDRYYETIGRGGFLVAPWVPGIDAHFTDREHLAYYTPGDTDALGALVDHYLDNPDERDKIAWQGNRHVREYHTYRDRVRTMLA